MAKLVIVLLLTIISAVIAGKIPDGRIIGGHDADIADFPYQVSLQLSTLHQCGGSIIGKYWIITAAHCFQDYVPASIIAARAGSTIYSSGGYFVKVEKIYNHPEFKKETMAYDVALIKTKTELFGENVKIIGLPEANSNVIAGKTATISGWGYLVFKGHYYPNDLQTVNVKIVDQEECKKSLSAYLEIGDTMFCAADNGKDACQGDSGGPIVVDGKLVGIVSFGVGCADLDSPGVYTRLANPNIRKWIKDLSEI